MKSATARGIGIAPHTLRPAAVKEWNYGTSDELKVRLALAHMATRVAA